MYDETRKIPGPFASGMLYLIVLLLMLLSSFYTARIDIEGDRYFYYLFILQLITIGLPVIGYLLIRKKYIKHSLRLNKVKLAEVLLSAGMAFFGYGVIIFINLLWMIFLSRFGEPQPVPIPPIENGRYYLMAIASMALAPAVLEEFMFRGVIQRGYEGYGRAVSIILTGIMFAFLHLSVVTIPAIIFMGILLCYIAYRADSVWASIAYHFTNNMIAITIAYVSSLISNMLPGDFQGMSASLADIPPDQLRMAVIAWAFIGFFALILFGACFAGFHIVTREKQKDMPVRFEAEKGSLLQLIIPLALAAVIIAAVLVSEVIHMINPVPVL